MSLMKDIKQIKEVSNYLPEKKFILGLPENKNNHYIKESFFKKRKLNLFSSKEENILFLGSMGSGKSISALNTVFFDYIKNGKKTTYLILDSMKGGTDFHSFFFLKNVHLNIHNPISSNEIDILYNVIKNKKNNDRFVIVIENIHSELNLYREENIEKMKYIFRNSAKKNIFILAISSRIDRFNNIYTANMLKRIHRIRENESEYIINSKIASSFTVREPGYFVTENLEIFKSLYIDKGNIDLFIRENYEDFKKINQDKTGIKELFGNYLKKINKEIFIENCSK